MACAGGCAPVSPPLPPPGTVLRRAPPLAAMLPPEAEARHTQLRGTPVRAVKKGAWGRSFRSECMCALAPHIWRPAGKHANEGLNPRPADNYTVTRCPQPSTRSIENTNRQRPHQGCQQADWACQTWAARAWREQRRRRPPADALQQCSPSPPPVTPAMAYRPMLSASGALLLALAGPASTEQLSCVHGVGPGSLVFGVCCAPIDKANTLVSLAPSCTARPAARTDNGRGVSESTARRGVRTEKYR